MIVIVATEDDVSAEAVAGALERLGRKEVLWLDLEQAFQEVTLHFRSGAEGMQWSIQSRRDPSLTLTADNVSAVYWRRPVKMLGSPFLGIPTPAILDPLEVFWSVRWLIESLPEEVFPLGHPYCYARAENKHRQLAAALQTGFTIPETCHANDPAFLADFVSAQGEVAVKAMRMPALSPSGKPDEARHIACKSFKADFLVPRLQKVERTQLYCQKAIQRKCDLRITVLPHAIIAAEIDTTQLEDNKLDWREHSRDLPHRIVKLDAAFEAQLRCFLKIMDLKAGYFDFAVPEEGPPVFFECNTNAGWLWIEELTGYPYAETIARELMGTARK